MFVSTKVIISGWEGWCYGFLGCNFYCDLASFALVFLGFIFHLVFYVSSVFWRLFVWGCLLLFDLFWFRISSTCYKRTCSGRILDAMFLHFSLILLSLDAWAHCWRSLFLWKILSCKFFSGCDNNTPTCPYLYVYWSAVVLTCPQSAHDVQNDYSVVRCFTSNKKKPMVWLE